MHREAHKKYEPGTGDWVMRSDKWKDWFEGRSRCVWIHGIPGAGKTVLASHLIENIKAGCKRNNTSPRKVACISYYCYFGRNQDEAIPFLKWAVSQLCRKADLVPSSLFDLYNEGCEPSLEDLLEVLETIVQVYDRIYIVVDAVDESTRGHGPELLTVLRALATGIQFQNVSILATSREHIEIEDTMQDISVPISMRNPLLDADIRLYVESQLCTRRRIKNWPADIRQAALEALSTKAKGMWVDFAV